MKTVDLDQFEIVVREAVEDDYGDLAAIYNSVEPVESTTAESIAKSDRKRSPKCRFLRIVAQKDDSVIGFGSYSQFLEECEQKVFHIVVQVLPEWRNLGVGTVLLNILIDAVNELNPSIIKSWTYGECPAGIHMLEKRGFRENLRVRASRLDLAAFDMSPYRNIRDTVRQKGIDIKTLEELIQDPERDRKLYDLARELLQDVPGCEDSDFVDFEAFVRDELGPHESSRDTYYIALHGSTYIGECILSPVPLGTTIRLNMTGVKREYRRQKVALALKLQAIASAKENGFQYMTTRNEVANTAILAINTRLGFERKADLVQYARAGA